MGGLELYSMDDLWEEIKKRSDAAVLIDMKSLDENRESSQISYKGGKFVCMGLIEKAKALILRDAMGASTMNGEA